MFNTIVGAGAIGAGAASRYGFGFAQMKLLLAAPAPQHHSAHLTFTASVHSRVGTKTLFLPFAKTKILTKSVLIFVKFCQFFAKGFCENFSRNVFSKV
jgi:hypothetical protein